MPSRKDPTDPLEQERLERLAQLVGEEGSDWPERFKPGSFGCHELLDRVSLLSAAIEAQLLEHASCAMNAEWYAQASKALELLSDLYQKIGQVHGEE